MEHAADRGSEPLLPAGFSRVDLLEAYRTFARAGAAEVRLARRPGFTPLAALAAAWPLHRRDDGTGDVLALATGSTVAALLHGASPAHLFRLHRDQGEDAPGRDTAPGWTDLRLGLLGPVGTPGTLLEVMAGITLAFRLRGEPRVGVILAGAAETATGAWHEAINLAAVQRCPLVVVVETRSGEGGSHPARLPAGLSSPAARGGAYGVHSAAAGALDLGHLVSEMLAAVERARAGEGVTLLEVREEGTVAGLDPVLLFRSRISALDAGMPGEVEALDVQAREEMEKAAAPPEPSGNGGDGSRPPFARPVPRVSPLLPA